MKKNLKKRLESVNMLLAALGLVTLATPAHATMAAFFTEVTALTTELSTSVSTVMIAVLGITAIFIGFIVAKKAMAHIR
jgi:hypothetical protein